MLSGQLWLPKHGITGRVAQMTEVGFLTVLEVGSPEPGASRVGRSEASLLGVQVAPSGHLLAGQSFAHTFPVSLWVLILSYTNSSQIGLGANPEASF